MAKLSKILVPTDFSAVGNRAVEFAVNLAKANRAKLILMTALDDLPLTEEEMMMLRVSVDKVKAGNQKQIDVALRKLKKLIGPAVQKKLRVQFMVRDGKPFMEIIRAAAETGADLIVMSSHGHNRLAEILLGSTTDRVVQKAPCSVLVVREKQRDFKIP
ncbi:MAG: universal stress protein [candidate division KSB1 bacterium]|nr:universal stress protein [candidate division KSB1 bacterium]MDZ7366303.1 universal stress protein [candidate division KSB1 bacterium]MDZ7403959.1 universal stress protein [candidate division KSB1 bacterium]